MEIQIELFEYLLVIGLPGQVQQRVEQARDALMQDHNIVQPQTGRPNISLARFCASRKMERKLVARLGVLAAAEKKFLVELDGFGGYPMHAIFIRILNQQRVLDLISSIKKLRTLMKAGGEDPYFLLDPQVALVGRMDKAAYAEAMSAYEHRSFREKFMAGSFLLLRKKKEDKGYELIKQFLFECTAAGAKQQLLFN